MCPIDFYCFLLIDILIKILELLHLTVDHFPIHHDLGTADGHSTVVVPMATQFLVDAPPTDMYET